MLDQYQLRFKQLTYPMMYRWINQDTIWYVTRFRGKTLYFDDTKKLGPGIDRDGCLNIDQLECDHFFDKNKCVHFYGKLGQAYAKTIIR